MYKMCLQTYKFSSMFLLYLFLLDLLLFIRHILKTLLYTITPNVWKWNRKHVLWSLFSIIFKKSLHREILFYIYTHDDERKKSFHFTHACTDKHKIIIIKNTHKIEECYTLLSFYVDIYEVWVCYTFIY